MAGLRTGHRLTAVLELVIAALLIGCGVWMAAQRIFWYFEPYDDEGYMLRCLISFVSHGGLYTTTFAQYGPFFFFAQETMHSILHLPYTYDGCRTLTLIYWLFSAACAATFVHALTRRALLTAITFLATAMISVVLAAEPGHPQEMVLALTLFAVSVSTAMETRWRVLAAFVLGGCGACLCLIKINAGLFFVAALFFALIFCLRSNRWQRVALLAGSVLALALPIAIMRQNLAGATLRYCVVATGSIGVLLFAGNRLRIEAGGSVRAARWSLWGFLTTAVAVIGLSIANGISPHALLNGIILVPLRHPKDYIFPIRLEVAGEIAAALFLIGGVALIVWGSERRISPFRVGFLKAASGLIGLLLCIFALHWAPSFILPLAWLPCWRPGRPLSPGEFFARYFLAAILVFEFLQAYPVAGSQTSIAFAPALAWGCLLIYDGMQELARPSARPFATTLQRYLQTSFVTAITLLGLGLVLGAPARFLLWHSPGPSLNLPGARKIRVGEQQMLVYHALVTAIQNNCDVLFSLPGMFSLNIWSGVPTPDDYNLTGWMTAFPPEMQQTVLHDLLAHSRPCIVYNPHYVKFWMTTGLEPLDNSPIAQYMRSRTRPVFQIAGYQLRVPASRSTQ